MRYLYILIAIAAFTCCQNDNNKTIEASTAIPETKSEVKPVEPLPVTKFVIIVVHCSEESTISFPLPDMPPNISTRQFKFTSDIYTVDNYSEDNKYRVADNFIEKVKDEFNKRESISKTNSYLSKKCNIINREMLVFDTYAEASIHKEKNY